MTMAEYVESSVRFDEENHRYYIGVKELSGITSRIHEKCAPSMNMDFASTDTGKRVHEEIETINLSLSFGLIPNAVSQHAINYLAWYNQCGMTIARSEYVVTDNERYASPIDIVFEDSNGKLYICDVKTYSVMTNVYRIMLQWQLSIYAYMFRLQNGYDVDGAFCLHVTDGKCERVEVELHTIDKVEQFLYDECYCPYTLDSSNNTMAKMISLSAIYDELTAQAKALESDLNTLKERLMSEMRENGFTKVRQGDTTFTIVNDSVTRKFDSKAFLSDHPEYNEGKYFTETIRKGYLRITKSKED